MFRSEIFTTASNAKKRIKTIAIRIIPWEGKKNEVVSICLFSWDKNICDQIREFEKKMKRKLTIKIKNNIGFKCKFWFGIIEMKYANIISIPPI